jgi:hypothetical protein
MRCAGHAVCTGEKRRTYRVLVGTLEGTRILGSPRHRWEDNVKVDLQVQGGSVAPDLI